MSIAIRAENLGKKYHIRHEQQGVKNYKALRDVLTNGVMRIVSPGKAKPDPKTEEFWALKDVSFEVKQGEAVGVIGRNGAGKSTLLKLLSRITEPSTGRIELEGRVSSLLEVGTGFHPELTGRENIYLNGAIMGMSRLEIKRKFDEIVAFAEVEKFLDTPVKRYSSGMYVRLAFAVAAHLEPEILVVDEVLAVGDAQFQQKCLGTMRNVASGEGRTVLFVSHNMQAVTTLCSHAILLQGGKVVAFGEASQIANQYLQMFATTKAQVLWRGDEGNEMLRLKLARVFSTDGGDIFPTHEDLHIQLVSEILQPIFGLIYAVEVYSVRGQLLAYSAHDDLQPPPTPEIPPGEFAWDLVIPGNTFAAGGYEFRVDVGIHNGKRIVKERICFIVQLENIQGIGRRYPSGWTHCFRPGWEWRRMSSAEVSDVLRESDPSDDSGKQEPPSSCS